MWYRTKDKIPFAVLEVTSENTRSNNITYKWSQYRRTGITFYYNIDLHVFETTGQTRVVVGSKHPFADAVLSQHGSPDVLPSSSTPAPRSGDTLYCKRLYSGDLQVVVGTFGYSKLTASQLMDPTFLKKKVKDLTQHNANLTQRNALLLQEVTTLRAQLTNGHASSSRSQTKPAAKPKSNRRPLPSKSSTESPANSPSNWMHRHVVGRHAPDNHITINMNISLKPQVIFDGGIHVSARKWLNIHLFQNPAKVAVQLVYYPPRQGTF